MGRVSPGDRDAGVTSREEAPTIRVRVPSKLNLFLAVRGRRDDGDHDIVSVLQTVGIHDEVTAVLRGAPRAQHPALRSFMEFELRHDGGRGVPGGAGNLAVQAARALLAALGYGGEERERPGTVPRTVLELHKEIPVAAGMAGGSADAAATLVACNELWACDLSREELCEVAVELGADVPFCLSGGTALATGTGIATARVLCRGRFHWVVGMSDEPLATGDVYDAWDDHGTPSEAEPDGVLRGLRTGDPTVLGTALHNDLQDAAFHLRPELREARLDMLDAGALGAVISGSGPTLLGLAPDRVAAVELAERLRGRFDRLEVASSPAGGPELRHGPA